MKSAISSLTFVFAFPELACTVLTAALAERAAVALASGALAAGALAVTLAAFGRAVFFALVIGGAGADVDFID